MSHIREVRNEEVESNEDRVDEQEQGIQTNEERRFGAGDFVVEYLVQGRQRQEQDAEGDEGVEGESREELNENVREIVKEIGQNQGGPGRMDQRVQSEQVGMTEIMQYLRYMNENNKKMEEKMEEQGQKMESNLKENNKKMESNLKENNKKMESNLKEEFKEKLKENNDKLEYNLKEEIKGNMEKIENRIEAIEKERKLDKLDFMEKLKEFQVNIQIRIEEAKEKIREEISTRIEEVEVVQDEKFKILREEKELYKEVIQKNQEEKIKIIMKEEVIETIIPEINTVQKEVKDNRTSLEQKLEEMEKRVQKEVEKQNDDRKMEYRINVSQSIDNMFKYDGNVKPVHLENFINDLRSKVRGIENWGDILLNILNKGNINLILLNFKYFRKK